MNVHLEFHQVTLKFRNIYIYICISLRGIALEQLLLGFLECGGCLLTCFNSL